MMEHQKKGCVEIEDWGFCVSFELGFQENFIYTIHLAAKILQNDAKSRYTKAGFKKKLQEFEQL